MLNESTLSIGEGLFAAGVCGKSAEDRTDISFGQTFAEVAKRGLQVVPQIADARGRIVGRCEVVDRREQEAGLVGQWR